MDHSKIAPERSSSNKPKPTVIVAIVVVFIIILSLTIGLAVGLSARDEKKPTPSQSQSAAEEYKTAAVATDAPICSKIGKDILLKGGTAADGAIASLICCGVYNMHSTGISGGGFLVLYNATERKGYFYDFRETGPASLRKDSFNKDPSLSKLGGTAVGVPGEIRGLRLVWKRHGKMPWKDLIQPSIDLARNGFRIGGSLGWYLTSKNIQAIILKDPGLREVLMKGNKVFKKTGDFLVDEKYATSLEAIRDNPEDLYVGALAKKMVQDINAAGGSMTLDDFRNYEVKVSNPLVNGLGKFTMYTSKLPGGGPVLTHILNMMAGYKYKPKKMTKEETILYFHRAVESFKFSYAYRPSLGDPYKPENASELQKSLEEVVGHSYADRDRRRVRDDATQESSYYNKFFTTVQDQGTTHVSVIDKDGNGVASTDTINYILGAKFRSTITGITYNNELADFFRNGSYPNKYPLPIPNAPGPGKRPLSSTCPTVITDQDGKIVMIAGASGGTRITLSTAWVIMRKLWFDMELGAAVTEGRPQHTFFPELITNEIKNPMPSYIQEGLKKKGHKIQDSKSFAVVQAIFVDRKKGKIYAKSDPRKHGKSAGY